MAAQAVRTWRLTFKVDYDQTQLTVTLFRVKCSPSVPSMHDAPTTRVHAVLILQPANDRRQTADVANTGSPSFDDAFAFVVGAS